MNKQILLLMVASFTGASVKAGLPGLDPEIAHFIAGVADQLNQAERRAEDAQGQLAQLRQQAEVTTAQAAQLALEEKRRRKEHDALLAHATEQEAALAQLIQDAEDLREGTKRLRKEKDEAAQQAEDFLKRLDVLTKQYEDAASSKAALEKRLKDIVVGKKQSDDEVQRLLGEVTSLSERVDFGLPGASISLPRVTNISAMVFKPQQFQREQQKGKVEKQLKRAELQQQFEEALATQKQMQDFVDEASAIVQEKDQEITALSGKVAHLEKEQAVLEEQQVELQNFKNATKDGYDYVDEEDIAHVTQEGAAAAATGPKEMPRRRTGLENFLPLLIEKLKRMARAALDEATE
jgi:predicted nuclease with TOPRIM domain